MKKMIMREKIKKMVSVLLAVAMLCTSAGVTAFAAEEGTSVVETQATEEASGLSEGTEQSEETPAEVESPKETTTESEASKGTESSGETATEGESTKGTETSIGTTEGESPKETEVPKETTEEGESSAESSTENVTSPDTPEETYTAETLTEETETTTEIDETESETAEDMLGAGADIASGKSNNISWRIDSTGKLTVTGTGDFDDLDYSFEHSRAPWFNCADKITSAEVDVQGMTDASGMFSECYNMTYVDLSKFDTSSMTKMICMFLDCAKLVSLDVSSFDTSKVTDMNRMFAGCSSGQLASLDLSSFDTSKVTNMWSMFGGCSSLASLDLSGFNTSKVTRMDTMFNGCRSLTSLDLSSFNLSSATNIESIFASCSNLTEIHTPYNVKQSVSLEYITYPSSTWYKPDKTPITELPKNLSYSIIITRDNPRTSYAESISARKAKTVYSIGEPLTTNDITVMHYGTDGSINRVTSGFTTDADKIDMKTPGEKMLTVTYTNNGKTLTAQITLSVVAVITAEMVVFSDDIKTYVYDGSEKKPMPTVGSSAVKLTGGTDYTVSYRDNINAGTATVIVTGTGGYTGTVETTFTIAKAASPAETLAETADGCDKAKTGRTVDISKSFASCGPATVYEVTVSESSKNVISGTPTVANGKLTYNTKACRSGAIATITLKVSFANYKDGTLTVNITTNSAKTVQTVEISGITDNVSRTYNGSPFAYTGAAKAMFGKTNVTSKVKFDYTYSGTGSTVYAASATPPTDAGTYKLTVTVSDSIISYTGSAEYAFTITKAPLTITACDMELKTDTAVPTDGKNYKYVVAGLAAADTLTQTPTFTFTKNVADNTYTIKASGATVGANYDDNIKYIDGTLTFVDMKDDSEWIVDAIPDVYYTGSPLRPAVTVRTPAGTLLKLNTHYTVEYKNNTDVKKKTEGGTTGQAAEGAESGFDSALPYVIIKGKGNYSESVSKNFNIQPASISDNGTLAKGFTMSCADQLVKSSKDQTPFTSLKYKKAMLPGEDKDYTIKLEKQDSGGQNWTECSKNGKGLPVISKNDCGTYKLTITGVKNYAGTIEKYIYVKDNKNYLMKNATITLGNKIKSIPYNGGQEIKPTPANANGAGVFTVKIGKIFLTPNTDYTVEYANNAAVGTATITVTGKGDYVGTKTATFKITGTPLKFDSKKVTIKDFPDSKGVPYTGKEITPGKDGISITGTQATQAAELTLGAHYTVTYKNNVKKGTATATFTAIPTGGYSGSFSRTFKINAVDLSSTNASNIGTSVTLRGYTVSGEGKDRTLVESVPYSKAGAKPAGSLVVTDVNNNTLVLGTDYTVSYANNTRVTLDRDTKKPTMTITGKGNYAGKIEIKYTVTKTRLEGNANIAQSCTATAYNPKQTKQDYLYKPGFKVTDSGKTLAAKTDYVIKEYKNCKQSEVTAYLKEPSADNAPYVLLKAAEKGAYSGELKVYLNIYGTKLILNTGAKGNKGNTTITRVDANDGNDVYTGKQLKPPVTVKIIENGAEKSLTEGVDYTLTYGANIAVGKGKGSITVTGKGIYGGSITWKFDIKSRGVK